MTKLKRVTDEKDVNISKKKREKALKLFKENNNLMHFMINTWVKKYKTQKTDDLVQDCAILFWKCCINIDEKRGKLSTFYNYRLKSYFHYYFVLFRNTAKRKINNDLDSLDYELHTSCGPVSLLEFIPDKYNYEDISDVYLTLFNIVDCLSEKEKKMVLLQSNGYSLAEIGKMYNVSKEWVRQVIKKALAKLKEKIESKE